MNYHEIKVDFASASSITTDIKLKQFDYGNDILRFMMYKGGASYDPTADFGLCTIRCERSDGRVNESEIWKKDDESLCGIAIGDDGVSYADVPYGLFESFRAGVVSFELIFYSFNDDGEMKTRVSLPRVNIEVFKSISSYNIVDKKSIDLIAHIISEMNALKTTAEAQEYIDMLEAAGLAEQDRIATEIERVSAELARREEETLRADAERLRIEHESERTESETDRVIAEEKRVDAETSRAEAEAERVSSESDRAEAEADRSAAEQVRESAETERSNAEALRNEAEAERKDAEAEREANEAQRTAEFAELGEKVNSAAESASADATRIEEGVAAAELALRAAQKSAGDAEEAAEHAESASALALESIKTANTAAENAAYEADRAKAGADRAEEKAALADEATLSATEAAERANSGAERVETAVTNAETATVDANSAAEIANASAVNADEKAQLADDAAERATTAAETAESAAIKANDAADRADDALGLLPVVPIELSASGENITITDSAEARLRGLKLYGKSEQNGTPSPDNPVEIVSVGDNGDVKVNVCGKNLFDFDKASVVEGYGVTYTKTNESFILNKKAGYVSGNIKIGFGKAKSFIGKTLCMSLNYITDIGMPIYTKIVVRDSNNTVYDNVATEIIEGDSVRSMFYVAEKYAEYTIEIRLYSPGTVGNSIEFRNIQVEIGQDITAYEPYTEQTLTVPTPNGLPGIPVSSGGNYTDESGQMYLCGEVDFERGECVQYAYKVVFTDNIPHIIEYGSTDDILQLATNMCDKFKQSSKVMCNYFMNGSAGTKEKNTVVVSTGATRTYFRFDKTQFETMADAVAWIKSKYEEGNPLTVIGILETPIRTPLSDAELAAYKELYSHYPVTNITNDAGAGMEVKYVADTKMYIDNKIAEMKEELTAAIITE